MRRHLLAASLLALGLALSACADPDGPGEPGAAAAQSANTAAGTASDDVVDLVDAATAVELLATRDDLIVIDVRTPEEFEQGYLQGAELLDLTGGQFEAEVGDLDRDASYLLYCRTGARSGEAASIMAELGFTEVIDAGGFDELAAQGSSTAP